MLTKNVRALIHARPNNLLQKPFTNALRLMSCCAALSHTHTHTAVRTNVHTALYTVNVAGAEGRTVFHRATSMDNAQTRNKSMPTEDRTST